MIKTPQPLHIDPLEYPPRWYPGSPRSIWATRPPPLNPFQPPCRGARSCTGGEGSAVAAYFTPAPPAVVPPSFGAPLPRRCCIPVRLSVSAARRSEVQVSECGGGSRALPVFRHLFCAIPTSPLSAAPRFLPAHRNIETNTYTAGLQGLQNPTTPPSFPSAVWLSRFFLQALRKEFWRVR